jgi:hypothetical protein
MTKRSVLTFSMPLLISFFLFLTSAALTYAAGLVPCNGADCDWCTLVKMIQNLINYAIYLGVLASAVMFAYTGFLFLTDQGNSENVSKAKGMFRNVVIGLACILGGWLLVDTLMKALTGNNLSGPWNKIQCSVSASNTTPLPTGGGVRSNPSRSYSDIGR